MMVVMLIVSIVLAAMAPVMTTKMKREMARDGNLGTGDSGSSIWKWIDDETTPAIYFSTSGNEPVMVGQKEFGATDPNALLILNADNANRNHILFKTRDAVLGQLKLDSDKKIFLGSLSEDASAGKGSIAIGASVNSEGRDSIVIGNNAVATGMSSIAIGSMTNGFKPTSAQATATDAIAIGDCSKATANDAIAIGGCSSATANDAIAIGGGYVLEATSENAIAMGSSARGWGKRSIAIGYHAGRDNVGSSDNSIVIGSNSVAGASGISIGNEVVAKHNNSISIGEFIESTKNYDIIIGSNKTHENINHIGNVVIGYNACTDLKEFDMNGNLSTICIGHNSGPKSSHIRYEHIYIGSKSYYNEAPAVIYIENDDLSIYDRNVNVNVNGNLNVEGNIKGKLVNSSDRRLKDVGKENKDGLDKIRQLKVFNYTFKKDPSKEPRVGVIAQDLQNVFPNAVKKASDGFLTIRMEDMFYAVVNAVKELDMKVTELLKQVQNDRKEIQALKKENKELKARIEKLEAKVSY